MQRYYDQFENCREHDIPYCADACPFKIDFLDIQEKLMKKRYNVAYKTIRNAAVFPDIVAALCPAYCQKACIRCTIDEPVQINMLEKTVMAKATRKKPNEYNLPAKKGKIAVIGAGISGMGFAFRLASKKYEVTVFEKSEQIGGHLWDLLPSEVFLNDFELQFQFEEYTLKLNTEIHDLQTLTEEGFDVIYVATGNGGTSFGIDVDSESPCQMIGDTAVFAGGSLCGKDTMHALADGISISVSAETFLKVHRLEYPAAEPASGVVANRDLLTGTPAIQPTDDDGTYTDEEAVAEASRCIRCQCDACQTQCDLVDFFEKWPISMRDEILLTCKPSKAHCHKNPAMRYLNTCTQCELLSEICPGGIDLCDMVKSARYKIHTLGKTPGAFRQYYLRDMEFANGSLAAIKKAAPKNTGDGHCKYAFFPGCNLGALDPDYVIRPYQWLLSKEPDVGMLLRCCSIPVDWDGNEALHEEEIAKLRQDWEELGKPILIMACMSCQKHLREYLPEAETISLYEVMANWGFEAEQQDIGEQLWSVFDPCSARNQEKTQSAVRSLAARAGIPLEELPKGDQHGCCGFGGMGDIATPEFTDYVAKKRSELSENPYVVYCSNCRDIFTDRGKPAVHILDLLFDIDKDGSRRQPTVTERRTNRIQLKETLLQDIWKEDMNEKPEETRYHLVMTPEIAEKVNKGKVLEQDICEVIEHSETTGRRTRNPENGHYKAYKQIGYITYWVEYGIDGDSYEIFNVYTHRMQIELEAVFNGRKVDL